MNASSARKIIAPFTAALGLAPRTACVVMFGVAGLTGCAESLTSAEPLDPRIQAHVEANRRYPRWEDFPAPPADLPPMTAVADRVSGLSQESDTLASQRAALQWTLSDSEGFAAGVAARIAAVPVSPDARRTAEEIDAYARDLRERGRAPPPIPRR